MFASGDDGQLEKLRGTKMFFDAEPH